MATNAAAAAARRWLRRTSDVAGRKRNGAADMSCSTTSALRPAVAFAPGREAGGRLGLEKKHGGEASSARDSAATWR